MRLVINIPLQDIVLVDDDQNVKLHFPVSTAARGVGETQGSYCTPRGEHIIRAKIGAGLPLNSVFVRRRPTGEIYSPELGLEYPGRDWILTRILWLSGKETGFNRGYTRDSKREENRASESAEESSVSCDTMRRYIYIHGTPDEHFKQQPESHGCIRMRNADILTLFDLVPVYTPVTIAT